VHGLSARGIISGAVPITIQDIRHRVKVDEHEAATGFEYPRDAPGPGYEIRKPADDTVRGEDGIETPAFARGLLQSVVQVGTLETYLRAGLPGEFPGGYYGLVADIYARDPGAEPGEAYRIAPRVALEMEEGLSLQVAQESHLLGE